MKKHVNIPVFVPHLGCPNTCVFCNQRVISGKKEFSLETVKGELDKAFSTVDPTITEAEIAFFGGSFTGIDPRMMQALLKLAEEYVAQGKATGIRLSTRPDYIDLAVLRILAAYPVRVVELGIQSVSDRVLSACERGHTFAQTKNAVDLLNASGIPWAGKMMIGLPKSSMEDELKTASFIAQNGAMGARIYPLVVFRDTALHQMVLSGAHVPLSDEEAIDRAAGALEIFSRAHIPVIRIGLHASESLSDTEQVICGANHPALGELVMSRLYLQKMRDALRNKGVKPDESVVFAVAKGAVSKALGQHGENREKLCKEFSIKSVKIVENPNIILYNIKLV